MCVYKSMMRVSEPILDMDMANYSEVLDPTYTTLEFETMQILYNSNGEFLSAYKYIFLSKYSGRSQSELPKVVVPGFTARYIGTHILKPYI